MTITRMLVVDVTDDRADDVDSIHAVTAGAQEDDK